MAAELAAARALGATLGADDAYLAFTAAPDAETRRRMDVDRWLGGRRMR